MFGRSSRWVPPFVHYGYTFWSAWHVPLLVAPTGSFAFSPVTPSSPSVAYKWFVLLASETKTKSAMRSMAEFPRRLAVVVLVLAGAGLLNAACGDSHSSGVASIGSTTTTATAFSPAAVSGGRSTAKVRAAFAYVACMRSHGVPDFPDPSSNGQITVDFAHGGKDGSPASAGLDRMSEQYISADQTCRHLLPGGVPTAAQSQQAAAKELRFSLCMRSHGVPNYPDPNPANPNVVHLLGIDTSSPQFQSAQKTCELVFPGTNSK